MDLQPFSTSFQGRYIQPVKEDCSYSAANTYSAACCVCSEQVCTCPYVTFQGETGIFYHLGSGYDINIYYRILLL